VARATASLRNARWDDTNAAAEPFTLADLLGVVQSFGGLPVYGWEFFDVHERSMKEWGTRLSLDWSSELGRSTHSLTLFQEPGDRILDLCIWFDELEVRDPAGNTISVSEFARSGRSWWDRFYAGDERTKGVGLAPLR
jgi:hypothetical protein